MSTDTGTAAAAASSSPSLADKVAAGVGELKAKAGATLQRAAAAVAPTSASHAPQPATCAHLDPAAAMLAAGPTATHARGPRVLTSAFGQPWPDNTHSLNVGGHVLASDMFLQEKQQTFNRAKTLERMVHPCGSGAFGEFKVTKDVSKLCCAKFLQPGKTTPVFVRFSTVTYGKEFPDSARNPRGFAIKFYTEDGNYDVVGLNFPIFFVRDPMMGPDVIRSQTRDPAKFTLNFDSVFDFMAAVPESLHCSTMFFSDRGTPMGWRFIEGYGCHTFQWVNDEGKAVYVKYHFAPEHGVRNFDNDSATKMCGEDSDFAKRDLWDAIARGEFPVWRMAVQVMTIEQANAMVDFDPFDVTKVWPHGQFPLHEVGTLTLNRNPSNYHRDVEQAAFSPGSMVKGIEPSPDELLQWRCFFYRDAQLHRLGVNLHQVPVNCPYRATAYHPVSRDGNMRVDDNGVGETAHYPSTVGAMRSAPSYKRCPIKLPAGAIIQRATAVRGPPTEEDDLKQVRVLYQRVMSSSDKAALHYNIAAWLRYCRVDIAMRFLAQLYKIDPAYAQGVLDALAPHKVVITLDAVRELAKTYSVDRDSGYVPSDETPPTHLSPVDPVTGAPVLDPSPPRQPIVDSKAASGVAGTTGGSGSSSSAGGGGETKCPIDHRAWAAMSDREKERPLSAQLPMLKVVATGGLEPKSQPSLALHLINSTSGAAAAAPHAGHAAK